MIHKFTCKLVKVAPCGGDDPHSFFSAKQHGIKSDSATSPDCATRIAKLGLRSSQDCATPLAQLPELRNSACATHRIAQLVGLRNFACATAFDKLRSSQDCATLLVQLRWPDCATLQLHFLQAIPAPIALENDTCPPQEQDVIQIPTPVELQAVFE